MKKEDLINILQNNDKNYDISLIPNNFNYNDKLELICHQKDVLGNEHGVYTTTFDKIKRGDGCPACSGRRMNTELFIAESKQIHGNNYNYDNFNFVNKKTKGEIYCNIHNQYFWQTPKKHLSGQGCPICRYEKSAKSNTFTTEDFIKKAKSIHSDKYDYSKSVYKKSSEKIEIICHKLDVNGNEHGSFFMTPDNHCHSTLHQGCPKCGREKSIKNRTSSNDEFIKKAILIHGNKYNYSKVKYINNTVKVCIICPKHGEFWMEPSNHLIGQGCPICKQSHLEREIDILLNSNNINFEYQKHFKWLGKQSLDFYLPDYNIAIECQGRQHYIPIDIFGGEKQLIKQKELDNNKMNKCKQHNIKLLYYSNLGIKYPNDVFEDKDKLIEEIYKHNK